MHAKHWRGIRLRVILAAAAECDIELPEFIRSWEGLYQLLISPDLDFSNTLKNGEILPSYIFCDVLQNSA